MENEFNPRKYSESIKFNEFNTLMTGESLCEENFKDNPTSEKIYGMAAEIHKEFHIKECKITRYPKLKQYGVSFTIVDTKDLIAGDL